MTGRGSSFRGRKGWVVWSDSSLDSPAIQGQLGDPETLATQALVTFPGRGSSALLVLGPTLAVLRFYRHGGMLRFLTGRTFLWDRAREEHRVSERLRARGVATPKVLARARRPGWLGGLELALWTQAIPGARSAARVLFEDPRAPPRIRRLWLRNLGGEVRRFHDAGGVHPDLNTRNLVLDESNRAWILDLDRGQALSRPASSQTRLSNLRRLERSARKLDRRGQLSDRDRLAFLQGYAGGTLKGIPEGLLPTSRGLDPAAWLYPLAGIFLLPLLPLILAWFGLRRPGLLASLKERLEGGGEPSNPFERPLLIHAASVGEVLSLRPLIQSLKVCFPKLPIHLTVLSDTGLKLARERRVGDQVHAFPLDFYGAPGRFLDRLSPRLVLIAETELWSGFYRALRARGIPLMTINMRIAPNRVTRYQRLAWFFRPLFTIPDRFGVQSLAEAPRVEALGAPKGRIQVLGDLKFDAVGSALSDPRRDLFRGAFESSGPLFVAGSIHPGEEDAIAQAIQATQAQDPSCRWIVAPRHLEKADFFARALKKRGISFGRRSQAPFPIPEPVLLLDSHGELAFAYAPARAAFVGGSLVPIGGHSPLEPAIFGVPVAFGPQAFNFEAIHQALTQAQGASPVQDAEDLTQFFLWALEDPQGARDQGERARATAQAWTGASERIGSTLGERWERLLRA